jgi:hypothetical protein
VENVDLRHVPVVDEHCHGIWRSQNFDDLVSWRRAFTESGDPGMRREHVATTVFYRRLIHALAGFFDCESEEEPVLAARMQWDKAELIGAMLRAADAEGRSRMRGRPSVAAEMGSCSQRLARSRITA